jgi:microcin C transport system substrate-binding protein
MDAGYAFKSGQLFDKNGKRITMEILNASPLLERVLLPIAENIKKLGIDVSVRTLDPAQYIRRQNEFDYDVIVGGWSQSPSPGNEQREFWGSQAAARSGSRNYAGLNDAIVDTLIERLIFSKNRQELVASTKALDRILRYHHFTVPMWNAPADRIAYWNKFGLPPKVPSYGASSNIQFWWAL